MPFGHQHEGWSGLARYQPLHDPEQSPFEVLDSEVMPLDMVERVTQQVITRLHGS